MFLLGDPRSANYKPEGVTVNQMAALEKLIAGTKEANDFTKRVILFVLKRTNMLSRPVALSLWNHDFGEASIDRVHEEIDRMNGSGQTKLHLFFQAMGTEFGISAHTGCYVPKRNGSLTDLNTQAAGTTIWCSPIFYDHQAGLLPNVSMAELETVALERE